ncbi:hypothetical protein [Fusobacterium sp. PH5-44]|uniref:hypothetical protein n=1 Tax=unclassified Fusobacterium TaxID=2648384 RepID=UPI003D1D254F
MNKEIVKIINEKCWHDTFFEKLEMNFDTIIIYLSYNEILITLACKNYIGISYLGHWDESVIKDIKVRIDEMITEKALDIIKNNNTYDSKGGGLKSINDEWYNVVIELIDNVKMNIICSDIDLRVNYSLLDKSQNQV